MFRIDVTELEWIKGPEDDPEDGEDEAKANAAAEEPEQSNPKKDDLLEYIKSMEV